MNLKRFQELSSMLLKFYVSAKFTNNKSGILWYHALCLDVLLGTSFTIVPYETCNEFYENEIEIFNENCEVEGQARFYVNCLVWNLRRGNRETAKVWKSKLTEVLDINHETSITRTFTKLRFYEALILEFSDAIETKNEKLMKNIENEMKIIRKKLKIEVKIPNFQAERFELLQIFYNKLKNSDENFSEKLENLENSSIKSKDYLALDMIKHTQRLWSHQLPPSIVNFWMNHSTAKTSITFDYLMTSERIFPFSFQSK